MNEAVRALVVRHCETLRREAETIAAALAVAQPDRAAAFKLVHRIKGSSGSLGFPGISDLALRLEATLRACADRPPTPQEVATIDRLHGRLQADIAAIAPEQSTLYQRVGAGSGARSAGPQDQPSRSSSGR